MKASNAIKKIIKETGNTQTTLAAKCGLSRQTAVSNRLNRGENMQLQCVKQFLTAMGYEIVFRPIDGYGEEYIIDDDETDD